MNPERLTMNSGAAGARPRPPAATRYTEALELNRLQGDVESQIINLLNLGVVADHRGRYSLPRGGVEATAAVLHPRRSATFESPTKSAFELAIVSLDIVAGAAEQISR